MTPIERAEHYTKLAWEALRRGQNGLAADYMRAARKQREKAKDGT